MAAFSNDQSELGYRLEVGNDGAVTYCIQESLVLLVFFWVEHVVTAGQVFK